MRAAVVTLAFLPFLLLRPAPTAVVGAKSFTESVLLQELMAQVLEEHAGLRVERRRLEGTKLCFDALRSGDIDLYAEYTGTGLRDILHEETAVRGAADAYARVRIAFQREYDLEWGSPFGLNNTYVLVMRRDRAKREGIRKVSDLSGRALRYGVSHEFLARPDGIPGLEKRYGFRIERVQGMKHDLAYGALLAGRIDVMDGYSTDARLLHRDLVLLEDDRRFFPPYEAAPLVRSDLFSRYPRARLALSLLAGRLTDETIRRLNHAVDVEQRDPRAVVSDFLRREGLSDVTQGRRGAALSLVALAWRRRSVTLSLTARHMLLTGAAVGLACLLGIPLGILVARRPRLSTVTLGFAGVLQTIPSIALLAFMLPLFGVGITPAIAALFLYGLLPIVRNTVTGLRSVDPRLREVGLGLGMRPGQLLRRVELPIAMRTILAGVRTSAVIAVGTATLAAFIGAGGLGDPIVTGLARSHTNLILTGAVPAALLAVAVDALLGGLERILTPRGLRAKGAS